MANAPVRNLIVNADDLAWTEGVNRGIAEAHRNGIVTSATLLANGSRLCIRCGTSESHTISRRRRTPEFKRWQAGVPTRDRAQHRE